MKGKLLKSTAALMMLSLVACGPGQKKSEVGVADVNKSAFPLLYESSDKEIKGGTIKVAVVTDSPFKGLFSEVLWQDAIDGLFISPITGLSFGLDKDFNLDDSGFATIKVDVDNKVVTVKFLDGLKWSDGQPLTIDDYIFAYEIIGNKDYTGVRYTDDFDNIIGMKEYKEGKATSISGLEKVSDTEVKIHFSKLSNEILAGGGGLGTYIVPKHYLSDVPIKDLEKSDKVRIKPLSYGPYKISQIVPGESVEYVPNEYYYKKDQIKVEKLIYKILPTSSAIASMKSGEYDIYSNMNEDLYKEYKDFDNLAVLGRAALYYQYLGFNLGKYENGENITDKNSKMYDLNLRKALGYAMNVEQVTKSIYGGLRERANGIVPPVFGKYYEAKERIVYNPDKAKELLDKAGYKDVNGDGIREDKNGKPFKIYLAFPIQGGIEEPLSQQYIQDWKAVGLDVELTGGRFMEGNSFFDRVQANDKEIDMWIAAWGVGSAFDPSGLYGRKSAFNFSRLVSDKNDELINKVGSLEALKDPEYKAKAVREFNENYMENELGFLPITFRYELKPVNKRLKAFYYGFDTKTGSQYPDAVTADKPFAATK